MSISTDFANKSVQAAIAAIEIYNKPNFSYREEAFALLMANAWELLLKAKWMSDHNDTVGALYEMTVDGEGRQIPKVNRSGNALSHGVAYLFFLMPISFYHGFESVEPASRAHYPEQIQKLLSYLDELESGDVEDDATQHVALRLETKLVRGKDACSVAFRWTDDPAAPVLAVREEDVLRNYSLTYRDLTDAMKRRYSNFLGNRQFHRIRKELEKEKKFAIMRLLNPKNPRSSKQRFYNANILQEFDRHYERRRKS